MGAAGSKLAARGRRSGPKAPARALTLLAGCLLLAACQPEGGDLVPLPPGEGAGLATKEFEADTLVVTREGVTLRARGRWSVADAATSVILDASNANAEPAVIDFERGELSLEGEGPETLRSVERESGAGGAGGFLQDKRVEVGGAPNAFGLEYWMASGDGRSGVPHDVKGKTVTLRLPVEVRKGTTVEFVFGFRCEERRPRR